jgi:hypothetical protein
MPNNNNNSSIQFIFRITFDISDKISVFVRNIKFRELKAGKAENHEDLVNVTVDTSVNQDKFTANQEKY